MVRSGDLFGDVVNVAARMQNSAMPGTVLISADTYHLVKELFEFKPRGATEVRGKSAPIETYELLAPIYGGFTEGFDTADLQEAKALLNALA